jgi:hypothetical protein
VRRDGGRKCAGGLLASCYLEKKRGSGNPTARRDICRVKGSESKYKRIESLYGLLRTVHKKGKTGEVESIWVIKSSRCLFYLGLLMGWGVLQYVTRTRNPFLVLYLKSYFHLQSSISIDRIRSMRSIFYVLLTYVHTHALFPSLLPWPRRRRKEILLLLLRILLLLLLWIISTPLVIIPIPGSGSTCSYR